MYKPNKSSKDDKDVKPTKGRPKSKPKKTNNRRSKDKDAQEMQFEKRSNDPSWYFSDVKLADQVCQLAFQNLAGYPIRYDGVDFDVPNIVRVSLNPAPGVQTSAVYNTGLSQSSAINMVGFRLYSKLSAYTGRVQSYAPQDVSTMILAFGEVISIAEFIRRAFGVAYTMNMRNRDYPKHILDFGMCVDADDLFQYYSDYRTRFNTIITLINQIPIPKNVPYFTKCAKIYERIYLDNNSVMAQTIVPVPLTTWLLDEQSYSGGSILKTTPVTSDTSHAPLNAPQTMAVYLNLLETLVTTLLNSSSLSVVYTDLLNYASKQSMEFWKMDYLFEGYTVMPEYDANFMLQMHNATITGHPRETVLVTGTDNVTPYNDVYPDPNKNSLFYNPAFPTLQGLAGYPARTGNEALIDMLTDAPTVTDRVECTRYVSICKGKPYQLTNNAYAYIDSALPDHYVAYIQFESQTNNLTTHILGSTVVENDFRFRDIAAMLANIDWAPRIFEYDHQNTAYTGRYTGDVNFYTVVDEQYIRKLHDFCGLHLYDVN